MSKKKIEEEKQETKTTKKQVEVKPKEEKPKHNISGNRGNTPLAR